MKHPAIGIDLGTTYCAVAMIDEFGKPKMLLNRDGSTLTPSVVQVDASGNAVVGEAAKNAFAFEPDNTAMFFKIHMGESAWSVPMRGKKYDAIKLSAFLLKRLKEDAESEIGQQVSKVVITVPAYFNDDQRVATRQAAEIAGLEVLQLVNEPTAAAIDYGRDTASSKGDRTVFVFDLGGGTLDATVLKIERGEFRVLLTDGLHDLGGIRWDQLVVDRIRDRFKSEHNLDISGDSEAVAEALGRAETAKKALSQKEEVTVQTAASGARVSFKITRADFERQSETLLAECRRLIRGVLSDAKELGAQIDEVLLVGGATRMPMIRELLRSELRLEPIQTTRVDENVARGAAYVAQQSLMDAKLAVLGPEKPPLLRVTDVSTHSLGVIFTRAEDRKQYNYILIKRYSPLPAAQLEPALTLDDGQTSVLFKVTEGESEHPDECTILGELDLPIPAGKAAGYKVTVRYEYDRSGILQVTAMDPATAEQRQITIASPLRLTNEQVQSASRELARVKVE
jgi:molecular chaperone DnaK